MADPDDSLSPEKRLLKLIEDVDSGKVEMPGEKQVLDAIEEPLGKKAEQAAKNLQQALSPTAIKDQLSGIRDRWTAFMKGEGPPLNFKQVNKTAKIFTFGMLLYLAGALAFEIISIQKKSTEYDLKFEARPVADMPVPDAKTSDTELFDDPDRRNVFIPYSKKPEAEVPAETALSLKLLEITKDFKLTGISVYPGDATRTFCMIEDVKKAMTSFLKVGDSISGLTVSEIKNDSVVLEHGKEKIELR